LTTEVTASLQRRVAAHGGIIVDPLPGHTFGGVLGGLVGDAVDERAVTIMRRISAHLAPVNA
jgi:hypothetical protein